MTQMPDKKKGPLKSGARKKGNDDSAALLAMADRKLKQAEMLLGVSRRIASMESLDEVLGALIGITTKELQAERGTLFLFDSATDELYSRVAQGDLSREIRFLKTEGIAGAVFTSGVGEIIDEPYEDPRFNRSIDERTGFKTEAILCAPLRNARGELIGVTQVLNPRQGAFTRDDLALLEAITTQAAVALQSTQFVEHMKKTRKKEMEFLDLVADIT